MRVNAAGGGEVRWLPRWEGGGSWLAIDAGRDAVDGNGGGDMAGGSRAPAVGGLVVLTGYEIERLGYLAALLSETLPKALWAPPPELHGSEREMGLALSHLVAGTTVVQLAEADQLGSFQELAERAGARFLHVLSTPPAAPGEGDPPAPDADDPAPAGRVLAHASASLTTQLEVVLAAWGRLRDTP